MMLDIAIVACKLKQKSKPLRKKNNLIMVKVHTKYKWIFNLEEKIKRNFKINDWICDSFVVVMDTCD
jgi:hypothetical protein